MIEEIEIEFKNMLTKEEYDRLIENFFQNDDKNNLPIFKQTNFYFDTVQFNLKQQKCALRIRQKDGKYILTLKEPHEEGLLETHQQITEDEAKDAIENYKFPDGSVTEKVKKRLADHFHSLTYLGSLQTERLKITVDEGLLVFDRNKYLTKIDYELEFECTNWEKGEKFFHHFLEKYHIPKRHTENKIIRFMNEKNKLGGAT